jgi:16S rRNA C1402 (ribose-2'-O) methylase RsmI
VWITSPTTLISTLTVIEMIIKNLERDKYTSVIHEELNKLGLEFARYKERWDKLARSIQTVNKDVENVSITTEKITKKFEEVIRGSVSEVIEVADTLKGEMVVVCSGYIEDSNKYLNVDPIKQVDELIVAGIIKNEAIKMVAKRLGITKQELYKEYSEKKNN